MSDNTLKYEGEFDIGQVIRSYDFQPIPGRRDCYVEGPIIGIADVDDIGYLAYVIECDYDSWGEGEDAREHTRVGSEVYVPMEVMMMEYDGRIVALDRDPIN